jgi:hypothetical protein
MSKKVGGFTEAEKLAAEFRRELKKSEDSAIASNRNGWQDIRESRNRPNERSDYQYSSSSSRRKDVTYERDGRSYKARQTNDSIYGRSDHEVDRKAKYDRGVAVDEFGRDIKPGMYIGQARSKSSSRDRSRSRGRRSWRHDKFDNRVDDDDDTRRRELLPKDYRPPSPTWISRAGGVAIMKKKATREAVD